MEYLDINISDDKKSIHRMNLPSVCLPVFKDIVKDMATLIEDKKIQEVFYSLSLGYDMQEISKKTGIPFKHLAYMYRKGAQMVCTNWKPSSQWKLELRHAYIKCRNYESLFTLPQNIVGQDLRNIVVVIRDQEIPSEYVSLLASPLEKLDINIRALRTLRKYNIYVLEDLLRFIKCNGFDALEKLSGMGIKSVELLYEKLRENNILESKETCNLFRYLFV